MATLNEVDAFIFWAGGHELIETVDQMLSSDPLERMGAEAMQLAIRIYKAEESLRDTHSAIWTLEEYVRQDLNEQIKAMRAYLAVLLRRIHKMDKRGK